MASRARMLDNSEKCSLEVWPVYRPYLALTDLRHQAVSSCGGQRKINPFSVCCGTGNEPRWGYPQIGLSSSNSQS